MALSTKHEVILSFDLTPTELRAAIENSKLYKYTSLYDKKEVSKSAEVLFSASISFRWSNSPEGQEFWESIRDQILSSAEDGVFSHGP